MQLEQYHVLQYNYMNLSGAGRKVMTNFLVLVPVFMQLRASFTIAPSNGVCENARIAPPPAKSIPTLTGDEMHGC